MDVGHGATYSEPNGGAFVTGPLAWLQWQLKGDAKARAMFVGDNCGFCSGTPWRLRRHGTRVQGGSWRLPVRQAGALRSLCHGDACGTDRVMRGPTMPASA